ncbi:MAG: MarR family transcriptional regulator [Pseudonocardia sp.]|nr:MarR family transcriptional regulator [Pseudonocardia sp.]
MTRTASPHLPDDSDFVEQVRAAGPALAQFALQPLWTLDPDVTIRQYRLLTLLDDTGPHTLGELATALALDPGDTGQTCEDLTRKNLIQRAPTPGDGREVRVELTQPGAAFLEHVRQARGNGIRGALTSIPPEERPPLVRALRRLAATAYGSPAPPSERSTTHMAHG